MSPSRPAAPHTATRLDSASYVTLYTSKGSSSVDASTCPRVGDDSSASRRRTSLAPVTNRRPGDAAPTLSAPCRWFMPVDDGMGSPSGSR